MYGDKELRIRECEPDRGHNVIRFHNIRLRGQMELEQKILARYAQDAGTLSAQDVAALTRLMALYKGVR